LDIIIILYKKISHNVQNILFLIDSFVSKVYYIRYNIVGDSEISAMNF